MLLPFIRTRLVAVRNEPDVHVRQVGLQEDRRALGIQIADPAEQRRYCSTRQNQMREFHGF